MSIYGSSIEKVTIDENNPNYSIINGALYNKDGTTFISPIKKQDNITTYEIPKKIFKLQNFIFKFMPKSTFENMGIKKNDFINLTNSMADLDIKSKVDNIKCKALILCGEKDNVNMESAKQLNRNIKASKLEIIKNAGHEVNTENPKELARVISKYWK